MPRRHVLERAQLIPRPRALVFPFFADAHNLETITPGFLGFRVLGPRPIAMQAGALITYRLRFFGIPFGWKTLIEVFDAPQRFVDRQLSGPYRRWQHLHTFEDVPGGTLMRDRVEYELPLGLLGDLAHALVVRRALARIFDFRRRRIAELFAPGGPGASARASRQTDGRSAPGTSPA